MEACLGLGNRQQRTTTIKAQNDLKQQHQTQQQQPHQHQQQHQQLHHIPVTQQNYYTQQHSQGQRQVTRGQTTSVGVVAGGISGGGTIGGNTKGHEINSQLQQQQLQNQQQQQQQQQQKQLHSLDMLSGNNNSNFNSNVNSTANVTANVTATAVDNTNTATLNAFTSITNANAIEKFSNNCLNIPPPLEYQTPTDLNCAITTPATGTKLPLTTLEKNTNTTNVEVTAIQPSATNICQQSAAIATNAHVHTTNHSCRKYTRHPQQQQQHQQQHQHQQLQQDLDAIEVCGDQEVPLRNSRGIHGRLTRTLGRVPYNELNESNQHVSMSQWSAMPPAISLQMLQQHQLQQQQHDYSYAYYEPGAAMRHTNIPRNEILAKEEDLTAPPPPPNSIRALLSKGKKNKLLVSPATRQTFQSRLTGGAIVGKCSTISSNMNAAASGGHSTNATGENLYEEISASSTSSSTNSMSSHLPLRATTTSHSAGSLTQTLVEEELRRVQNRHRKVLGELNLSVEAMLMPESPPHNSPKTKEGPAPTVSVTSASGQPLRLTSTSADNICDTSLAELLNTVGPTDELLSPIPNPSSLLGTITCHTSCLGGDLDSGFSGSSGASYIGSLRLHKTNALLSSRLVSNNNNANNNNNSHKNMKLNSTNVPASSAFAYATHSCRSFQRASTAQTSSSSSSSVRNLPQIHQNHLCNSGQVKSSNVNLSAQSESDSQNTAGFFTRAACGRRILNCAKIRAAEDPGPVIVIGGTQTESKARSFWNRKGWRKQSGLSTSTSSINDTGLSTDESKVNCGSWEETLPTTLTQNNPNNSNNNGNAINATNKLAAQHSGRCNSNSNKTATTITTAQLHNITLLKRSENRSGGGGSGTGLQDPLKSSQQHTHKQQGQHQHQHHYHSQHNQHTQQRQQQQQQQQQYHIQSSAINRCVVSSGGGGAGGIVEGAINNQQQSLSGDTVITVVERGNTIAGDNINANGGNTAVGENSNTRSSFNVATTPKHLDDNCWITATAAAAKTTATAVVTTNDNNIDGHQRQCQHQQQHQHQHHKSADAQNSLQIDSSSSEDEDDEAHTQKQQQQQPQQQQQQQSSQQHSEETNGSVTSSLSATNQRNSQLRLTFNRAKQHLSFDKWRTSSNNANTNHHSQQQQQSQTAVAAADNSNNINCNSNNLNGGALNRRSSSTTVCPNINNMPTAQQSTREEMTTTATTTTTTPIDSPGVRISRWFSIRRGSSHQYDVGGRDGRPFSSSNADVPDATCDNGNSNAIGHKHKTNSINLSLALSKNACKMPEVPENEDDDDITSLNSSATRFDIDLMIPPGSRANGTARNAHNRLVQPMLPPPPPGLSQQQLKRRHIVAAIVHSENSYVATLQRLVNDYKKPLEDNNPPILSVSKIGTLFHRLPEILQSHQLFRIALAECVRNWDRDEKLGDCFVSAFSKPRILEIYSGFINNFSAAMELAKAEEKRKSALADFFKMKQISAHDRLSFFGLMVKPVQRFPQFILFLQDLLKYTPQGHHDRMSLQLALTQLELLAEMLNERKREAEQYQGFKEMLSHISGTFNTRSLASTEGHRARYLLREDNVTHMEFNQSGFIVKSKQRRLLLLNDKVICVSVAPKQSHDFGATEKLTFKWMYPVTDVDIVDNSTSATLSRILTAGLNRGGSLKSNSSSCNNYSLNTLPGNNSTSSSSTPSVYQNIGFENHLVAPLTTSADNLCSEMSNLMYDYEVVSRINELVGSLKGTYKELNTNIIRNLMNSIQTSIQHKTEEMAWVDSCCLQLLTRNKSGKEETFTFQTANPNVKKEWITELRLAQLALDPNNSPAWETTPSEPITTAPLQQQQMQLIQRQSNKMPLFVKAMPLIKSQHQTEVRCGCYYSIANDSKISGNARRRHKQLNYLWICTSDGTLSHVTVYSQHHQQAGNLRDVGSFDIGDCQVTALEFIKGVESTKTTYDETNNLLGDLIWMGTDSCKLFIYSAKNPEQEEQLANATVPATVMRILYHFDNIYVALANATILIYRRTNEGIWSLKEPQMVALGESALPVPSILPINMNIYAACGNRVYVLNAISGEVQRSFEVQHGATQQVNLMAHSGIGLWISLKNSTMLCLYHTETFKHLQDINIASSVLRSDGKKEHAVNNSAIYVTALMACKGLLWVGTNVGIAVTIPLPRLEGVPIISGGISMSCHAHFGPITFLLPLVPKTYSNYNKQTYSSTNQQNGIVGTNLNTKSIEPGGPSMGDDLQLPAIDADPKKLTEADLDESTVILRRDLPKEENNSEFNSPSRNMLRELISDLTDSASSSPRTSKLEKQQSLDQSFSAKIRASLANSPAFHRKRFRDLSSDSARMSRTLPRGLGSVNNYYNTGINSNSSTLTHGEHGYCDVYGLYGKLIFVKEDYDAEEGTQGNLMDIMYEGMRRSDPELAAIPGRVSTLDRRLRMKASRPRSLDLSNWSVDSKSSSLYTSSGSEESMGIRLFGGRSVSRNSSSASHKTSGNGSDLGNISENGLMTSADLHNTPKSDEGFKLLQQHRQIITASTPVTINMTPPSQLQPQSQPTVAPPASGAVAAAATLKRKQKQNAKQQLQQQQVDGPRTIITLTGGRGYWRHIWYNQNNSPGQKPSGTSTASNSGATSPLIANSNDAHIVIWEKKL